MPQVTVSISEDASRLIDGAVEAGLYSGRSDAVRDHLRSYIRSNPELADQVIVFATDSQWEGPVAEEMSPHISRQYWLNFESGSDADYPVTEIKREQTAVAEGE